MGQKIVGHSSFLSIFIVVFFQYFSFSRCFLGFLDLGSVLLNLLWFIVHSSQLCQKA